MAGSSIRGIGTAIINHVWCVIIQTQLRLYRPLQMPLTATYSTSYHLGVMFTICSNIDGFLLSNYHFLWYEYECSVSLPFWPIFFYKKWYHQVQEKCSLPMLYHSLPSHLLPVPTSSTQRRHLSSWPSPSLSAQRWAEAEVARLLGAPATRLWAVSSWWIPRAGTMLRIYGLSMEYLWNIYGDIYGISMI